MASPFTPAVALRGEHTGGAISVMDNAVPARWGGPPLHHHEFDETFYVLDGELTFLLGSTDVPAPAGTFVLVPPGVEHTFANRTETPVRVLNIHAPAGFDLRLMGD